MNHSSRKNLLLIMGILVLAIGGLVARKFLGKPDEEKPADRTGKREDQARNEATCHDLAEMAGGRKVRLVWVESTSTSNPDIFARSEALHLGTFDSPEVAASIYVRVGFILN